MKKTSKLTIGLSLSLSGRYAAMGCQAESALRLFAADTNAAGGIEISGQRYDIALECADDQGDQRHAASIYRELSSSRQVNLLFSPYGSALTRAAAPIAEAAGLLFVNHGGADDGLYQRAYRMLVGVLTPASGYMTELARLISNLKFWRKRVAIVSICIAVCPSGCGRDGTGVRRTPHPPPWSEGSREVPRPLRSGT